MNLSDFSVNKPVTITMIILIMMVLGVVSFVRLGLDFFPDLQFPEVAVITTYPGASPEEIETLITRPLEESVATVSGVVNVKSTSREGLSVIQARMRWGANLDLVAQDIRNMMDITYDFLPDQVERPLVMKSNIDLMPVLYFGVTSQTGRNLRNLRKIVEDQVEKRLQTVEGVASVTVAGGLEREILVEVDRKRLEAHNLSLDDITRVIQQQNMDIPGGHITRGPVEYVLRTVGRFGSPQDIADTIIKVEGNNPVYIKDVAAVNDSHKEVRNISKTNKRDSVVFWVTKESEANTVRVVNAVTAEIDRINLTLPPDVEIINVWDTSKIIRDSINQLGLTVRWGGMIIVFVLFLFLWNLSATFTLIVSIPFAIVTTFVGIYFAGYTLNLITLSGIALGVGMIVDNSVVVLENIFRHREMGEGRIDAAKKAAREVAMPITASTLTSVIVFVPLVFAGGVTGEFTRPLGLTVTFALFASLLVALTIIPMLSSQILVSNKPAEGRRFFPVLAEKYKHVIRFSLNNRVLMVGFAFVVFVSSILLTAFINKEYLPKLDEIYTTCVVKLSPASSLDETYKFVSKIEETIFEQPEFRSYISLTGITESSKYDVASGAGAAGVNEAQIFFEISPKAERRRTSIRFIEDVIAQIPEVAEGSVYFMQTTDYLTMGAERPIEIKIFGSSLDVLREISDGVEAFLIRAGGITEIDKTLRIGKPELKIEVDRQKASHLGITVGQVAETVETAFLGREITKYREEGDEYDVRVRLSEPDRRTVKSLEHLAVASPFGFNVNLSDVAKIVEGLGPAEIRREDQERVAVVSANYMPDVKDLGTIREEVLAYFSSTPLPEGYFFRFGGAIQDMGELETTMLWVLLLVSLLVYMVMAAQFESLSHPLSILITAPLSFIGVTVALIVTGTSLSVMSYIGLMMLIGIVVNNGIVLIDYINRLRAQGMAKHEAIVQAGSVRLRPIMMTTLTTILALIPMAVSRGEGAELFSPIAITIFGGLLTSAVLTLVVLPAIYSLIDGVAQRALRVVDRVRGS